MDRMLLISRARSSHDILDKPSVVVVDMTDAKRFLKLKASMEIVCQGELFPDLTSVTVLDYGPFWFTSKRYSAWAEKYGLPPIEEVVHDPDGEEWVFVKASPTSVQQVGVFSDVRVDCSRLVLYDTFIQWEAQDRHDADILFESMCIPWEEICPR